MEGFWEIWSGWVEWLPILYGRWYDALNHRKLAPMVVAARCLVSDNGEAAATTDSGTEPNDERWIGASKRNYKLGIKN